jgi:nucleotide-binding universal stress UspA family protein
MTILVPTDFSDLSKVAAMYAVQLAKKLKADIIILAVININASAATSIRWEKLQEEMIKIASEDAAKLIQEIKADINGKLPISYHYTIGYPVQDLIESFTVENDVDMIIMGTKGATGLKKVLMGSNATAVIDNSSKPVIAVPGETVFKPIEKIVYATDMANLNEEIKAVAQFAQLLDAHVKVLHVIRGDSDKKFDDMQITADLINLTGYPKISFHVSRNDFTADEVDSFVVNQEADLLAMFTHKLDFYEKLFGKSITRQLAFHAHVPLLTFNKTTLL